MNKNVLIVISIVIILFFGGAGLLYVNKSSNTITSDSESMIKKDDLMEKTDEVMTSEEIEKDSIMMKNSRYIHYVSGSLDNSEEEKRVLFFYANWCPTCRPVDSELSNNLDKIPEDVSIIRVNYNDDETDSEEKELAKKYGITYQHTFVQIDESGREITKWNGGGLDNIITKIK